MGKIMVSGIRPTLNTFKRIYWNDKNIKEILQMITKKELSQKALELCWEIEKFPASEQQTKVSIMASELHRLVDGLVMQAVSSSDENSGNKAEKPIFIIKPKDDDNFNNFIQLFVGENGSLAIIKNNGYEIHEIKKLM